jgi:hypothetical protein
MNAHEIALKGQAKRLRSALADEDVVLGHRKTLDLIARVHGWHDWNTLSAVLDQRLPADNTPLVLSPPMERKMMTSTPYNDGSIPDYLGTKLTTNGSSILNVFNGLPDTLGKWTRERELEREITAMGAPSIIYIRQDAQQYQLSFALDEGGTSGYVSNVLPRTGDIKLNEANKLEMELVRLMQPLLPSTVQVTQKRSKHLRDLVQPSTYAMFQRHSANKSTGNSHPNDRKRWLKFVEQAAREGLTDSDEHRNLVHAALISEGFAPRHADQISQDFERHIEMAMMLI